MGLTRNIFLMNGFPHRTLGVGAHSPPMHHHAIVPSSLEHAATVATALCIAPLLVESSPYSECILALAVDDDSSGTTSRPARRTRPRQGADQRAASYISKPSPTPNACPQNSLELIACRRRNIPAPTPASASAFATPAAPNPSTFTNPWQCPHCEYAQHTHLTPDLNRHIRTHTRGAGVAAWGCCGVLIQNAVGAGVPAEVLRDAPIFEFGGILMMQEDV